jgi:hypothetical protein
MKNIRLIRFYSLCCFQYTKMDNDEDTRLNDILEESLRNLLESTSSSQTVQRSIPDFLTQNNIPSIPLSNIIQSVISEIPNMLSELSFNEVVYLDSSGQHVDQSYENATSVHNEEGNIDLSNERNEEIYQTIENSIIDLVQSEETPGESATTSDTRRNINTNEPTFHVNTTSNTNNLQNRNLEILDDFIASWFRQTRDYNEQMQLYHQNISQMVRVSQNLARILQGVVRPPPPEPTRPVVNGTQNIPITSLMPPHIMDAFNRNGLDLNMDIRGFSIPIPHTPPPNVHPTISQILEGTERYNYTPGRMGDITNTRCPISLEDFQLGDELCEIKHCHHIFKWRSLQSWFSRNSHCPVCRYDLREYTSSTSS